METSRESAEGAILAALKELEKPLSAGDFAAQKRILDALAARLKPLRISSLDKLEFDARTRLFTALLRAGRQSPVEDPDREAGRKAALGAVGDLWRALSDDRRAALVYAAAGASDRAVEIFAKVGEWREIADLFTSEGRHQEAGKLLEQRKDFAAAAAAYEKAGDRKSALRVALFAGDREQAREHARRLPLPEARELLMRHGAGDLVLDLLAGRGEWGEIAQLYARSGQWADAAMAHERAGKPLKALEAWRKAERTEEMERLLAVEANALVAANNWVAAGELMRRFGASERAIEIVRDHRPEIAFRWLQQDGRDDDAIALAKTEARRADGAHDPVRSASWLERAGELPAAAEAHAAAKRFRDASRLWQQLGDWERAGEAAARGGARDEALVLLRRAGVADPEGRIAAWTSEPSEG